MTSHERIPGMEAYSVAIQLIGNAFVARRDMLELPAQELVQAVLADASLALRAQSQSTHASLQSNASLYSTAADIVDRMRRPASRARKAWPAPAHALASG
jgi:hypothetical protein